jgi:hypothetical protein
MALGQVYVITRSFAAALAHGRLDAHRPLSLSLWVKWSAVPFIHGNCYWYYKTTADVAVVRYFKGAPFTIKMVHVTIS